MEEIVNKRNEIKEDQIKDQHKRIFSSQISNHSCDSGYESISFETDLLYKSDVNIINDQRESTEKRDSILRNNYFNDEHVVKVISEKDDDGDTELILLAINKYIHIALQVIQHCTNPKYLNTQNNFGQSVLHIAVYLKQEDLIRALINKGARVDLVDYRGRNIYHYCAEFGYLNTLQYLCSLDQYSTEIQSLLNTTDYAGLSPFFIGVQNRNKKICQWLSHFGANVNSVNPKNGNTVLHEILLSSYFWQELDFIKFLINECHVDDDIANFSELEPYLLIF